MKLLRKVEKNRAGLEAFNFNSKLTLNALSIAVEFYGKLYAYNKIYICILMNNKTVSKCCLLKAQYSYSLSIFYNSITYRTMY